MRSGTKHNNPEFINTIFEKYLEKAALLSDQGNLSELVRCYKNIIRDFPEPSASLKLQLKMDSLMLTKDYIKSLRSENKERLWELEKQNALVEDLNLRVRTEILPDSILNWWTVQIRMLRSLETGRDTNRQNIATRVLMLVNVVSLETGRNYLNIKKYGAASICYRLASITDPENKNIHFMLAKIYALNNETAESLRSLEKAIKLGYENRKSIEKEPAFIPLKNMKRFIEILNEIKQ
jgi:tetratricopeptide (TPR) repeat protein